MDEAVKNIMQIIIENKHYLEFFLTTTLVLNYDIKSFYAMLERKAYHNKNINVIKPPKIVKSDRKITLEKIDKKYQEDIKEFYNILKNKIGSAAMINFYNNLEQLQIKENKDIMRKHFNKVKNTGSYSTNNVIELTNSYSKSILFHELLHLSSSCVREGDLFIGFNQITNTSDIGRGINEGYTELLNKKFFSNDANTSRYYKYLQNMALLLEKVIGENKLQSYYFNSDLLSLLENLSEYCGEEKAKEFIKDTDYIYRYFYVKEYFLQNDLINKSLKNVSLILLEAYYHKLQEENLSDHDRKAKLQEFTLLIPETFYSGDKTFYIIDQVDIKEFIEQLEKQEEREKHL